MVIFHSYVSLPEATNQYKSSISIGLSILNHPFLGTGRPEPLLVWWVARGARSRLAACMAIVTPKKIENVFPTWYKWYLPDISWPSTFYDWGCKLCTCLYQPISESLIKTDTMQPQRIQCIQQVSKDWLGETNVPSLGVTSLLFFCSASHFGDLK